MLESRNADDGMEGAAEGKAIAATTIDFSQQFQHHFIQTHGKSFTDIKSSVWPRASANAVLSDAGLV